MDLGGIHFRPLRRSGVDMILGGFDGEPVTYCLRLARPAECSHPSTSSLCGILCDKEKLMIGFKEAREAKLQGFATLCWTHLFPGRLGLY